PGRVWIALSGLTPGSTFWISVVEIATAERVLVSAVTTTSVRLVDSPLEGASSARATPAASSSASAEEAQSAAAPFGRFWLVMKYPHSGVRSPSLERASCAARRLGYRGDSVL